jgi:hypothetical protein
MLTSIKDGMLGGGPGMDGLAMKVTKAAPLKGVPTLNNPIELTKE